MEFDRQNSFAIAIPLTMFIREATIRHTIILRKSRAKAPEVDTEAIEKAIHEQEVDGIDGTENKNTVRPTERIQVHNIYGRRSADHGQSFI